MISFKTFDPLSEADCSLQAKWENDTSIRHLFNCFSDEAAYLDVVTPSEVSKRSVHEQGTTGARRWMILKDGGAVGEMSFSLGSKQLITPSSDTAWAGIVIGEASARGSGIGKVAMSFLETQAKAAGARRVELGVFEFNEAAFRFYKRLGYREIARIPEITYWNGRKWADIRMLKELVA